MRYKAFLTKPNTMILDAMSLIDEAGRGILYIVNDQNVLIGSLTDGDIRRWIIKTNNLNVPVSEFMNRFPKYVYETERQRAEVLRTKYSITSVPVLNRNNEVIDIIFFVPSNATYTAVCEKDRFDAPVVIMAGGKGTRLYPYTKILPKPLIPVGDVPILERIFNRFHDYGIGKFYLTVNYRKNMIKSYFNELHPDYELVYVEEDKPLGTGGSLKLIKDKLSQPIIVANCDQLIKANYKSLYDYHIQSENDITVVASLKKFHIPYGVLQTKKNGELAGVNEKPTVSFFINTGMYVINPETIDFIPDNQMFHMTHLIEAVKNAGGKVGIYPISEDSFLDMGEFSEMQRMEEKLNKISEE